MNNKVMMLIKNILENPSNKLKEVIRSGTKANIMGDSLEDYIKNAFANTFFEDSKKLDIHEQFYSWNGNQNNPPDMIIRNDIAIEVKKIEGYGNIALNSSFPKSKINSCSNMITKSCKECEGNKIWEKDLVYCIGKVNKNKISDLFIVYGRLYAANEEVYIRIKKKIETGIEEIQDIEFTETNELGKVKKVDPLGITDLRIRGMWSINNPYNVYKYIPEIKNSKQSGKDYIVNVLIPIDCINLKELIDIKKLSEEYSFFSYYKIKVKNPNNPSKLIECYLLRIEIEVN